MALDFGGMAALSQVDNWGAIRAEKARELQLVAMRNAIAEQEVAKQAQAGAAIEQYLSTINDIKVLEQDRSKIESKNSELTKVIQEGIKKHDGNVKKYLYAGGLNELNKYRNNLLQSEEVKRGLTNAFNYNRYLADKAAGLNPRLVSFDVGGHQKTGRFEDNYQAYVQGNADVLNYQGAFETPTGDPREFFGSNFGNPYKRPQAASAMDVAKYWAETAKQKGLSKDDAEQYGYMKAMEYDDAIKKGLAPYQYKSEDNELKNLQKQKLRMQIGALAPQPQQNWLYALVTGDKSVQPDEDAKDIVNLGVTQSKYTMSADRSAAAASTVNLPVKKDGMIVPQAVINKGKFVIGDKELDVSMLMPENIKSAIPTGKLVATKGKDGKMTYGVEVQITMNEPGFETATYGGEKIKNWYGLYERQQVPGAKKKGDVVAWNGEDMTVTAVAPIPLAPQTFIDFNRLASESTPSQMQNVSRSFGQASGLQNFLQMEAIFNDAEGVE